MTKRTHQTTPMDMGNVDWADCPHVERNPRIMTGAWCFEGTRLPISTLFANLAAGLTIAEYLEEFPSAKAEHIAAVLQHQADRLDAVWGK